MSRRPITRIFVVNPPGLGKRRRKAFEKQFQDRRLWPPAKKERLPPIAYYGINKNYMDLTGGSKYRHLIADDRSSRVKLKLRLGFEKHAENFREKYDPMLCSMDGLTRKMAIGHLACSLSHVEIWKLCRDVPDDQLCMILEDDALINPAIEFGGIEWPETADLLHLCPKRISFYENYSDDYAKIVRKRQGYRFNDSTAGYIITPACARYFLSEFTPWIVNRAVDTKILYRAEINALVVKKPWVHLKHTISLIEKNKQLLHLCLWPIIYRARFLFPESVRARHPLWLQDQKRQFDESQPR